MSINKRTVATFTILGLAGLASTPAFAKEKYQRVVPPTAVVEGLQKVVIVDHTGSWGDHFNKHAAEALRSNQLGLASGVPTADAPIKTGIIDFIIVSGQQTMGGEQIRALAEQNGAQAVLVASATGRETAYESYSEDRKGIKTLDNGERVEETWTVKCGRRDVEASWEATLYSAADGSVVLDRSGSDTDKHSDCDEKGDDPLKVKSANEMIGSIITRGAANFTAGYAPYWDTVKIGVPKDRATRDAVDMADEGDWVTAVEMANELLLDDPYNAVAVYLNGLALELNGRASEAAGLYKFAERLKDDSVYDKAVTRARQRAGELEVLSSAYGLEARPGSFTGVDALIARATKAAAVPVAGSPVTVKGGKNKRIPVTAEQSTGSEIVASVPGGTEVRKIKEEGGRAEIQLPDGLQGWIDGKLVK